MALALPPDLPGRDKVVTIAFAVVAFSVIVQGLTVKPLLVRTTPEQGARPIPLYNEPMWGLVVIGLLAGWGGADLDAKVASVLPTAQEDRWLEIPWRTELMSARVEAREQGKPLFVWTMNGHPLGTT